MCKDEKTGKDEQTGAYKVRFPTIVEGPVDGEPVATLTPEQMERYLAAVEASKASRERLRRAEADLRNKTFALRIGEREFAEFCARHGIDPGVHPVGYVEDSQGPREEPPIVGRPADADKDEDADADG